MNTVLINNLLAKKVITKIGTAYRLKRPMTITIAKSVIEKLKAVYIEDGEKGGILEGIAFESSIMIVDFLEVKNQSQVSYNYSPNTNNWNATINEVISRGNLPFGIHTHPIRLGIERYDAQKAKFYLKPSSPDKAIARDGINDYLELPEAIFTKDSRLDNGFGLVFYTGWIFPASNVALSTLQIITGAMAVLFRKQPAILMGSLALLVFDFFRRPKYRLLSNGNYQIKLSY